MITLFDHGSGAPIVVVTGLQGRWEWTRPALEALAEHGRTVGYSLLGEPGSGGRLSEETRFDAHLDQLDRVWSQAGLDRAAVCGVSYGGWVALRYAARRRERVRALVLVSAPGPRFRPDARQSSYMRAPWLLAPLFLASSRARIDPEIRRALPDSAERRRFRRQLLAAIARAPASVGRMARRMRLALQEDFVTDCAAVEAPTLVVTGEPGLDRVVSTRSTAEYLDLIGGAVHATLVDTGHVGLVTRPAAWAAIVGGFVVRVMS